MSKLALAIVLALAACGGDDTVPVQPDAAPPGPACTKAVFDVCSTNADCTSGDCHYYMQQNFSACTQPCTYPDNNTCPVDSSGNHAECNKMNLCKPAAANNCHL